MSTTGLEMSPSNDGNVSSMNSDGELPGILSGASGGAFTLGLDPSRVTLHIIADPHEICPLLDLYQPVINWVDHNLKLFRVTERVNAVNTASSEHSLNTTACSQIPAIAVMVFLRGADPEGDQTGGSQDRIQEARRLLKVPPWQFHHHEKLNQGKINAVPTNSQEFFYTSPDLPLWAIRHVHYGNEHVRFVLYATDSTWPDQVHFYRLILGLEPDLLRDDFCLFTVYKHNRYDVQFALKKLEPKARIVTLESVHIQVKVKDVGQLVPLFPNVCRPISDVKWQTTDHDGNVVVLDVINPSNPVPESRKVHRQPSYLRSDLSINTCQHHHFLPHQCADKEGMNSSRTRQSTPAVHFPRSDNRTHSHFPFTNTSGQFTNSCNTSAFSDSDDLDIDLPSPPLRVTSQQEEDEESLTLTNTSEESGIQMQHGSEDLSFCEEEPLRPCLSKNSSLKLRHVKLKVRFKDEVEAFEDDSFSRLSSGIESEDQSDSEMETRFPYVPPQPVNLPDGHSPHSKSPSGVTDDSVASKTGFLQQHNGNKSDMDVPRFHNSLHISHDSTSQTLLVANVINSKTENFVVKQNITQETKKGVVTLSESSETIVITACDQNRSSCSTTDIEGSKRNSVVIQEGKNDGNSTSFSNVDNKDYKHGCLPLPPYPSHRYRNPPSYHSVCSQINSEQRQPTPQVLDSEQWHFPRENTIPPSHSSNNPSHMTQPSTSSAESDPVMTQDEGHRKNRKPVNTNVQKKECTPPLPPTRDNKTKLRSTESNPPPNNKLRVQVTKSDSSLELRSSQNGYKTFWFENKSSDLSTSGTKTLGSQQEETTLKFTLKFDTCPTSGLSCRQEQIGFYV